jgi:hypothetical protein
MKDNFPSLDNFALPGIILDLQLKFCFGHEGVSVLRVFNCRFENCTLIFDVAGLAGATRLSCWVVKISPVFHCKKRGWKRNDYVVIARREQRDRRSNLNQHRLLL